MCLNSELKGIIAEEIREKRNNRLANFYFKLSDKEKSIVLEHLRNIVDEDSVDYIAGLLLPLEIV